MEVVLLLSAERDLQEAYNWVEEHRRGREQFFLQDVELRLEHLKKFPLVGRLYRGRYRRLLIPRYPFGIFYVVESNRIVVDAAQQYVELLFQDQLPGFGFSHVVGGGTVLQMEIEWPTLQSALGVDIVDHNLRDVPVGDPEE